MHRLMDCRVIGERSDAVLQTAMPALTNVRMLPGDRVVTTNVSGGMSVQGKFVVRSLQYLALALVLITSALPAAAQTYPSRPIRIVVPLPPGANGDLMPRILAQHLSAKFGQPVVIENRPGAAQNLGAELVFRSEHDG